MKPVKFAEVNGIWAKDQPPYLPLPAHQRGGMVTTCWQLTFAERVKILFTGRLWLQQLTFRMPLQPQRATVHKPVL